MFSVVCLFRNPSYHARILQDETQLAPVTLATGVWNKVTDPKEYLWNFIANLEEVHLSIGQLGERLNCLVPNIAKQGFR